MSRLSIPPNLISAKLSQNVVDLRQRIAETSTEATTGRRADLTQHLSGRIGNAMLSQKALTDITNERGLLGLRETRLDIVQQSLTGVRTSVDGLSVNALTALGGEHEGDLTEVAREAKSALDAVFRSLNVRHGERYMFSGDATSTQPLADTSALLADLTAIAEAATGPADFNAQLDTYFNDPAGGWQQSVFGGTASASDPDAVTAADPAITKLISGLATLALSGSDDDLSILRQNPALVQNAVDRLSEGQVAITSLQAERGVIQKRIADDQSALDVEETILTAAFNRMAGRDQYEAASELQELESALEASYLLTARLSNLSLLNYLR